LALFGHEEDARLFFASVGSRALPDGWRVREIRRGEVASMLLGSRATVVALDPPPGAASDGTAALVAMERRRFLDIFLSRDGGRQIARRQVRSPTG
jgi:hypothetical protein